MYKATSRNSYGAIGAPRKYSNVVFPQSDEDMAMDAGKSPYASAAAKKTRKSPSKPSQKKNSRASNGRSKSPGTYRDANGRLRDNITGKFVKDPNAASKKPSRASNGARKQRKTKSRPSASPRKSRTSDGRVNNGKRADQFPARRVASRDAKTGRCRDEYGRFMACK